MPLSFSMLSSLSLFLCTLVIFRVHEKTVTIDNTSTLHSQQDFALAEPQHPFCCCFLAAAMDGDSYADLSSKPFYGGLTRYLASGPVVAMVWEGKDVIATGRKLIGATNPLLSEPGTIRGDYCIELGRNIIHGSDSQESAAAEIKLWFTDAEISNWTQANKPWIYE